LCVKTETYKALEPEHVQKIYEWFIGYTDVENHVKVVTTKEIAENDRSLNIPLYVEKIIEDTLPTVEVAMADLKSAWAKILLAEEKFKSVLVRFIAKEVR
jgi:type I restriction enzyme M protein